MYQIELDAPWLIFGHLIQNWLTLQLYQVSGNDLNSQAVKIRSLTQKSFYIFHQFSEKTWISYSYRQTSSWKTKGVCFFSDGFRGDSPWWTHWDGQFFKCHLKSGLEENPIVSNAIYFKWRRTPGFSNIGKEWTFRTPWQQLNYNSKLWTSYSDSAW